MVKYIGLFVFMVFVCMNCGQKVDEDILQAGIKNWWQDPVIEDVVIDECYKIDDRYEVSARLVFAGDTTKRMGYVFKDGDRMKLIQGPYKAKARKYILEEIGLDKLNAFEQLRVNTEVFRSKLEAYAQFTGGKYPVHLDVKISEISDYEGDRQDFSVLQLIPECVIENPYVPEQDGVMKGRGDTLTWFPEYRGKVVYFPLRVSGKAARDYRIRAYTDRDSFFITE